MYEKFKKPRNIRNQYPQPSKRKHISISLLLINSKHTEIELTWEVLYNCSPWRIPLSTVFNKSCSNQEIKVGLIAWYPVHEERYINEKVPAKHDKPSHESGPISNQVIRMNVVIIFKEIKRQIAPLSVCQRDCICGQWKTYSDLCEHLQSTENVVKWEMK